MNSTRRLLVLALVASSLSATLAAAPASAAMRSWVGRVTFVSDGDTFEIDLNRDGVADEVIRMVGINTPEGHYRKGRVWGGTCHSLAARNFLANKIEGKRVELRAQNPASTASYARRLRFVHLLDGTDVNALMLKKSFAVAYPHEQEPARNARYTQLANAAARNGQRIWNPKACGRGPKQYLDPYLKVRLRWDANGNDEENLNGEYTRIENSHPTEALSLKGWILRDTSSYYYFFKDRAVVPPKGSVTVHAGAAPSTHGDGWSEDGKRVHYHYYWAHSCRIAPECRSKSLFNNAYLADGTPVGDGAYLYDPDRDLRKYMNYPCYGTCVDPKGQSLELKVQAVSPPGEGMNGEWVKLRNIGSARVDMSGYMVVSGPWTYEFLRGSYIDPGEVLTLYVGSPEATHPLPDRLHQYWRQTKERGIFAGSGETLKVESMEMRLVKKLSW